MSDTETIMAVFTAIKYQLLLALVPEEIRKEAVALSSEGPATGRNFIKIYVLSDAATPEVKHKERMFDESLREYSNIVMSAEDRIKAAQELAMILRFQPPQKVLDRWEIFMETGEMIWLRPEPEQDEIIKIFKENPI